MKTNDQTSVSRRQFLTTGLAAAAFTVIPRHVLGRGFLAPSDQITLGVIGTGKQGKYLALEFAKRAKIIAGCDVYQVKLDKFKTDMEQAYQKAGSSAKGLKLYRDFRELLGNKSIDAVIIATPDHWHAINVIEAAKAGKDIYCEKPYSHSIEEGRLMVQAVEKYQRINQTGNMQRSRKDFRHACQLVRNGHIGDVKEVKVCCGPPPKKYDLLPETKPEKLDWDLWIGPAVYNEFNAELAPPIEKDVYPNWRNYKEYGNGMTADWGAHMFDIAQWGLGKDDSGPSSVNPPGKNTPLTFVYDNGTIMTHEEFGRGYAVRFIGTKGIIDISRGIFETLPANLLSHQFSDDKIKLYESDDHYNNWLDSIKTRKPNICTAEIGHRTATVCFLANLAYELQRPLRWNPATEKFIDDEEADRMRAGYLRTPWSMTF
ncbi:MAG: Gfo/Idh/MocA family oxidoreductase [Bacteroidales bacterium]|jgi:predicted dehydrogenase|nr:Gfo/Idh/MocA family oxidoreductase [Bacteroidales bacterium]